MKAHVLGLLCVGCFLTSSIFATAVLVRSDGKQIAVAADSKRKDDPSPECKVRRVQGGVFFAAGDTMFISVGADMRIQKIYDAYMIGVDAAGALGNAAQMIERFSRIIDTPLAASVSDQVYFHRDEGIVSKLRAGFPVLQAGYALFVDGKPSFYVRTFFPVVRGPYDITFNYDDRSCPGTCESPGSRGDYAPLRAGIMETWVRTDPTLLSKTPLDFATTLIRRAAKEVSTVGEPLTRLTISSDDLVNWEEIGPCVEQPTSKDQKPEPVPTKKK